MHLEILVEDSSGKALLDSIVPRIVGADQHSFRIHPYRGVGHLPKNLQNTRHVRSQMLLNHLPRILRGYGRAFQDMSGDSGVVVVLDVDGRNCRDFKADLVSVADAVAPHLRTLFRIAIEEMEAWLLGDRHAVRQAYPQARDSVLDRYAQDDICDTWEVLADAVYPGGARALKKLGYPVIGTQKHEWARSIAPYLDIEKNASPSFQMFRDGLRRMVGT